MKSKKNIYILLPIVLLIWGLVVHQFYSFTKSEATSVAQSNNFSFKPVALKPKDTATIDVRYRDPFLGKMYSGTAKSPSKKHAAKTALPKPPPVAQAIAYKGIVSDSKGNKKVFMLIINGRTFLMKKGDTESEVLLKDGNRESITVKNKGILQTIPLQV